MKTLARTGDLATFLDRLLTKTHLTQPDRELWPQSLHTQPQDIQLLRILVFLSKLGHEPCSGQSCPKHFGLHQRLAAHLLRAAAD